MSVFKLRRLGLVMEPDKGNAQEAEGVLNPAAVRGPDGGLYLFPRLVARGNYSRIGIARVCFNEAGDPVGVERLGIVLEPEANHPKSRVIPLQSCPARAAGRPPRPEAFQPTVIERYTPGWTGSQRKYPPFMKST